MSIRAYDLVWHHSKAKPGGQKLVLLALAEFANKDTLEAWPAIETLEKMTGYKERHIQMCLRELEKLGEIETVALGGGRKATTRYRLTIETSETVHPSAPFPDVKGVVDEPKTTHSDAANGARFAQKRCSTVHPNQSEPIQNQSVSPAASELANLGEEESDEQFFARLKRQRPDVDIPASHRKFMSFFEQKRRTPTREAFERWIAREKRRMPAPAPRLKVENREPDGWREYLKSRDRPYREYRYEQEWVRSEFNQFQKERRAGSKG